MANQLSNLLAEWYPNRDNCDWVLGTVYKTEGPCYRKAGAMMLFNSVGQQFGMLSGGCLESDIQVHARKVMQSGQPVTLCYDGSDEDDLSFRLGIGCGGTVHIMLHPVHADNQYQQLDQVYAGLKSRRRGTYFQPVPDGQPAPPASYQVCDLARRDGTTACDVVEDVGRNWLMSPINPDPHLLVVGGGIDARPVVTIAKQLGWMVSVWDPRPANGRREFFMSADALLAGPVEQLPEYVKEQRVDAAVLISHSIPIDAAALAQLNGSGLSHMALLGPMNRKEQVLKQARLSGTDLKQPLSGPAGLDIGGELPESIALSILAECHAVLHKSKAQTINREMAA